MIYFFRYNLSANSGYFYLNRIVNFDFLKMEATSFLEVDMGFAWALFGLILIDFSPTKIPLGQP